MTRSTAEKRTVSGYMASAVVLLGLAAGSLITIERIARVEEAGMSLIRLAEAQRTMTQRVWALAETAADTRDPMDRGALVADLQAAITDLKALHADVVGDPAARAPESVLSKTIATLYAEPPHTLDPALRQFLTEARTLAERLSDPQGIPGPPTPPAGLQTLRDAARTPLMEGLDAVVSATITATEQRIAPLRVLLFVLLGLGMIGVVAQALFIFRPMTHRLKRQRDDLADMARADPLTGAANRTGFMTLAEAELARAKRHQRPLSLLALDIDNFKRINDTWGHEAGDEVIRAVAWLAQTEMRRSDIFGRIGGQEFAAMLPETDEIGALDVAEKLRQRIVQLPIDWEDAIIHITISVGVTTYRPGDMALTDMIRRADEALADAKSSGQDRVIAYRAPAE